MQLTRHLGQLTAAATLTLLAFVIPWTNIYRWAVEAQREFQDAMASALLAVQDGSPTGILALCAATFAYGFVHALGPGHGKILLGGAAFASQATLRRMALIALASSMAQAGVAIALVGLLVGGLSLITSGDATTVADDWLAPLSYGLFVLIGAMLVVRGLRGLRSLADSSGDHGHGPCGHCGHCGAPTPSEVDRLSGWRATTTLIGSIAVRPCTGALFLLVIALRFDILAIGTVAVLFMGFGTAAFNALVAVSSVLARQMVASRETTGAQFTAAALYLVGGGAIMLLSIAALT